MASFYNSLAGSEGRSSWIKPAIVVGSGIALSGALYALYRYYQQENIESRDEGFFDQVKPEEPITKKVLVLGLDGSGKSSLLSALMKESNSFEPRPTEGFNVAYINTDQVNLSFWEIGGAPKFRKCWNNFYQDTCVLVFVVDATNEARFPEAFDALHEALGDERLHKVPILLVASKQDVEGARSPDHVLNALGLDFCSQKDHLVQSLGTKVPYKQPREGVDELQSLVIRMTSEKKRMLSLRDYITDNDK